MVTPLGACLVVNYVFARCPFGAVVGQKAVMLSDAEWIHNIGFCQYIIPLAVYHRRGLYHFRRIYHFLGLNKDKVVSLNLSERIVRARALV